MINAKLLSILHFDLELSTNHAVLFLTCRRFGGAWHTFRGRRLHHEVTRDEA